MLYNKEKIEKITRKVWNVISSIMKSIIVLIVIGVVMLIISSLGGEVYRAEAIFRHYTGGWNYEEYLNVFYGLIGIIIYILNNFLFFLTYNGITNKFKNYNIIVGKIMFIIFNVLINLVMLFIYSGIFSSYLFKNELLEILNKIIVFFGWITFPVLFSIIYKKR